MIGGFEQYREARKGRLDQAFEGRVSGFLGGVTGSRAGLLKSALKGGKKVRGTLLCLVSDALEGDREQALPRAVAVELIHAASLIHDDYVDQDRFRRRAPAVWTLSGSRNAVLLGDVIFASAIEMMSAMGPEDGRLVSRAIAQISAGALMEPTDPGGTAVEIGRDAPGADLYEEIIFLKTGVLFGTACELGAVSAGVDREARRHWFRYGSLLGEAYQIADDTHDIKKVLAGGGAAPGSLAPLVPAFLRFVEEMRPRIPTLLSNGLPAGGDGLEPLFRLAVARMEEEIEERLQFASAEILAYAGRPFGALARRAPRDIIEMFNRRE